MLLVPLLVLGLGWDRRGVTPYTYYVLLLKFEINTEFSIFIFGFLFLTRLNF